MGALGIERQMPAKHFQCGPSPSWPLGEGDAVIPISVGQGDGGSEWQGDAQGPPPLKGRAEISSPDSADTAAAVLSPVVSDSSRPRGLQPARLLCLWDFPGKNTGVGCHFLFQGIFLIQGSNLHLFRLLHGQARFFTVESPGKPVVDTEVCAIPSWFHGV